MSQALPKYADRLRALHEALADDFRTIVRDLPNRQRKVIDAGCGDGFFTRLLAETHAEITGIDNSDAYLEKARTDCRGIENIRFLNHDVAALPLADDSVDVVWSAHSMQSYPDIHKVLREFRRVLRPDGLLAVLESDNLHAVMLSWPPDVELALMRAEHCGIGDEDTYLGTYFPRFALRLFEEVGLSSFHRKQYLITRFGPATGPLRMFVQLYLQDLIDRVGSVLSDTMRSRLARLADASSSEFLPCQADFAFSSVQTLILGRTES